MPEVTNMSAYDDAAAARRYEDPEAHVPAGPPVRRRARSSKSSLSAHVPVRFGADLIAAVKRLADSDGVTVSTWIRNLVKREVERRRPPAVTQRAPELSLSFSEGSNPTTQTIASEPRKALAGIH